MNLPEDNQRYILFVYELLRRGSITSEHTKRTADQIRFNEIPQPKHHDPNWQNAKQIVTRIFTNVAS